MNIRLISWSRAERASRDARTWQAEAVSRPTHWIGSHPLCPPSASGRLCRSRPRHVASCSPLQADRTRPSGHEVKPQGVQEGGCSCVCRCPECVRMRESREKEDRKRSVSQQGGNVGRRRYRDCRIPASMVGRMCSLTALYRSNASYPNRMRGLGLKYRDCDSRIKSFSSPRPHRCHSPHPCRCRRRRHSRPPRLPLAP